MKKIILALFVMFLVLITYNSDIILFNTIDSINKTFYRNFHISFVRNQFIKFVDAFNPYVGDVTLSTIELPEFNIKLSKQASDRIKFSINKSFEDLDFKGWPYMRSENNPYVDMQISIKNQIYKGKLRLHGTDSIHYRNNKKSLAIKLSKDKLFENMRRFSLIVINEASIASIFSYKVQHLLTGFKVNSYLVKVNINGISQGVYVLEEKLSQGLLEKNNLSGIDIIRPNDDWDHQYQATHETPFNWDLSNTIINRISAKNLGQMKTYKELYQTQNIALIKAKLDLDRLAQSEALQVIFNEQVVGDNQKLLYDTSVGRFFRYFRTENVLQEMSLDEDNSISYDTSLYGVNKKYPNNLFIGLIQDNEFRQRRNKELWRIVQRKDELIKLYYEVFNKNKAPILADSNHYTNGKKLIYDDEKKIQIFSDNIEKVKKYLRHYDIEFNIKSVNSKYLIEFNNLSNVPYEAQINSISFTLEANIDKNLYSSDSFLRVEVEILPEFINFTNTITGDYYIEPIKKI
jgi:hypothetical protein